MLKSTNRSYVRQKEQSLGNFIPSVEYNLSSERLAKLLFPNGRAPSGTARKCIGALDFHLAWSLLLCSLVYF
ncbi:MAG: hypothetical protein V1784_02110 [bacterium]